MIEIKDLNLSFNSEKIFENLNLNFKSQQISVILGESGSGKSTLLKVLADLLPESKIKFALPDLSYVFQEPILLPWLSVKDNIELPLKLKNKEISSSQTENILKQVGLFEAQNKKPFELSGGMKMRASIARALITNPQYLFMDEPFSALDELTRFEIQDLLLKLQTDYKITVLFVTHSLSEALYIGHEIFSINRNQKNIRELMQLNQIKNRVFRKSAEFQELYSKLENLL